jgi:gliding motility-associated-like protein
MINGSNVGSNSESFLSNFLKNQDTVTCLVTGSNKCSVATLSEPIIVNVVNPVMPSITISVSQDTICPGTKVDFIASTVNEGIAPIYRWILNGSNTGVNSSTYSNSILADNDIISCTLVNNDFCVSPSLVQSNNINIHVKNTTTPKVRIDASDNSVCYGSNVDFKASITDPNNVFIYQWKLNDISVGMNNPSYSNSILKNGDIITCTISNDKYCDASNSNPLVMVIYPLPTVQDGPDISINQGQSVTLNIPVTGDISSYLWTPKESLSDYTVRTPVATPYSTTGYKLVVESVDGCKAEGNIKVIVSSEIAIPSAFTPNGDGKNDVFYILGGPAGSLVKSLTIFDRWGNKLFQVKDVPPNVKSYGWNGSYKGMTSSPGAYPYIAEITFADGSRKDFKGTVVLIR